MRSLRRGLLVLFLVAAAALVLVPSAAAMNWGTFNAKVTKGLGAEVTLHTRRALVAEAQTEGGTARNNLYNTTLRMPGSSDFNWVHVQNYPTAPVGVLATILTLKGNGHGYERIRRRLRSNASAVQIVRAFGESDWGTDLGLGLAVLDDVRANRWPNTLANLEARQVTP